MFVFLLCYSNTVNKCPPTSIQLNTVIMIIMRRLDIFISILLSTQIFRNPTPASSVEYFLLCYIFKLPVNLSFRLPVI